jgi:NADP-dependent 3-hydroxy acid dehydrogenase YdfG
MNGTRSLEGRWALVTGASSGFGEAIARRFASEGCHLAINARRADRLERLAADLRSRHGVEVEILTFDVRDRGAVERTLGAAEEVRSRLDILVNNAGLALALDPIQRGDPADWDQMIDTNVKGLLYVTRACLPAFVKRGAGDVVNLGSVAGHQVYAGGAVYSATKFAVRALSDALRHDVLGTGIRVINVEPGLAETEFSLVRFQGDAKRAASVYEGVRPLAADDVADALVWAVTRPPHVNVQQILLLPTDQAGVHALHRRKP